MAALQALLSVGVAIAQLKAAEAAELEVPYEHPAPEDDADSCPAAPASLAPARRRASQLAAPADTGQSARASRLEDAESGATAQSAPDLAQRAAGGRL